MKKKKLYKLTLIMGLINIFALSSPIISKSKHAGKIVKVNRASKEIIVGAPKAYAKFIMGKKVYLKIKGKTVTMLVIFPMGTVARCRLIGKSTKYLYKIKKNMKVYLTKKSASLDDIKSAFKRIDKITLYTGKIIMGAIVKREGTFTILTQDGQVEIRSDDIQNVEVIK